MKSNHEPKISVLIPSLNHARYLRDTLESIFSQTLQDVEIIVVDGGSTDGSIDILKEYPQIRWISEKETDESKILEVFRKAFAMSSGDYIMQCCVSDGYLSRNWFKMCSNTLVQDNEISLVWGLPQYMTEDSNLGKITNPEFLMKAPPQKKDFLAYWLAYGYGYFEGNYCVRRKIFDECFPQRNQAGLFSISPQISFLYQFNTRGYLPYFLPVVANFGRTHANQRVEYLCEPLDKEVHLYLNMTKEYKKNLLNGSTKHYFKNGSSEIIGEVKKEELRKLRMDIWKHYIKYKISKRLLETQERL
jgi:glycosyltransferase involved in cell wall biosynthesis